MILIPILILIVLALAAWGIILMVIFNDIERNNVIIFNNIMEENYLPAPDHVIRCYDCDEIFSEDSLNEEGRCSICQVIKNRVDISNMTKDEIN